MNVSVALCTYNGSSYINKQIDSILSQTFTPDEIIVCDDRSTDETMNILSEYEDKYPNLFTVHSNSQNLGPNKNFERCIRHCSDGVIAICDQDDVWFPTKLERQVEAIKQQSEPLIYHNSVVTSEALERRTTLWDSINPTYCEDNQEPAKKIRQLTRRNYVQGATILFDTSLRDIVLPIPQNWNYDYWIAVVTAITKGIYGINESLLLYRQHQDQVIGSKSDSLFDRVHSSLSTTQNQYIENKEQWEKVYKYIFENNKFPLTCDEELVTSILLDKVKYESNREIIYTSNVDSINKCNLVFENIFNNYYEEYSKGLLSGVRDTAQIVYDALS